MREKVIDSWKEREREEGKNCRVNGSEMVFKCIMQMVPNVTLFPFALSFPFLFPFI